MKKKNSATQSDKKDWNNFIENLRHIEDKEIHFKNENEKIKLNRIKKLDLHGYTLLEANKKVKNFINQSFEEGLRKLLIVTGKGSRSKVYNDPYRSEEMSILKNSIPDFIKSDQDLSEKTIGISEADTKDGGKGAIYILLKNKFR